MSTYKYVPVTPSVEKDWQYLLGLLREGWQIVSGVSVGYTIYYVLREDKPLKIRHEL